MVRAALRVNQVAWALPQAEKTGAPKIIYINIDDSLGEKDKHTCHRGTRRLVPRPQRKHTEKAAYQDDVLLLGMRVADWGHRCHGRPAREDGSSAQSPAVSRTTYPLPQQEQSGSQYLGSFTPTAAQRLDGLCAVRQLVRFRTVDQICPPSRACPEPAEECSTSTSRPRQAWPISGCNPTRRWTNIWSSCSWLVLT